MELEPEYLDNDNIVVFFRGVFSVYFEKIGTNRVDADE